MIRIFLTGYMGAGKTTLGKALARELHIPFIDLDWYIEERFHKTVGELFSERGEASFRELEKNMLHEVGEFEDVVIPSGRDYTVSYKLSVFPASLKDKTTTGVINYTEVSMDKAEISGDATLNL